MCTKLVGTHCKRIRNIISLYKRAFLQFFFKADEKLHVVYPLDGLKSFFVVYILLEERKKKACEMINGYVSKPKKRRDKNIGLKSSQKVSLYTITRKTEYYYKM